MSLTAYEKELASDLRQHNKRLADELAAHDRLDTERFDKLTTLITSMVSAQSELHKDVKSLLATRSFTRGVWWAVVTVSTAVSGLVGVLAAYFSWKAPHP